MQRKLHAPCEWGEKPEAESQGLTYPYVTNAAISRVALCPSFLIAPMVWIGLRAGGTGKAGVIYQNREL